MHGAARLTLHKTSLATMAAVQHELIPPGSAEQPGPPHTPQPTSQLHAAPCTHKRTRCVHDGFDAGELRGAWRGRGNHDHPRQKNTRL